MDKGFIKLSRSFFDNNIWQAARAFSECEAWIDLIQSARFEASPTTSSIGVYEVTWGRGQYPASRSFLSKKWGRPERWVRTILGKWKRKGMITIDDSQGISIITLVNYEKYNGECCENGIGDQPNDQLSDQLNALNYNELKEQLTNLVTNLVTNCVNDYFKKRPASDQKTKKEEELEKESTPNGVPKKAGLSLPSPSLEAGSPEKAETPERMDYKSVMETFNRTFGGQLPRVTAMTEARKKAVRARVAEHGRESIQAVFRKVAQSAFLIGSNERNWTCDFDWIFRPTNYVKILEGNYDGDRNGQSERDSRQRKLDSAVAIATRVQEAAARRREELRAAGIID